MLWKLLVSLAALLTGQQPQQHLQTGGSHWKQQSQEHFIATTHGPKSLQEQNIARQALYGRHQGGDMILPEDYDLSTGIKETKYRWQGYPGRGTVFYTIDSSVASQRGLILRAMEQFHKQTCIRFVERTNQNDYVRIFKGQGCYAQVGRQGGRQDLSLGEGCMHLGTVVHQLGHVVGLFHEHQRSDRDNYITIHEENIAPGKKENFEKNSQSEELIFTEFDYSSIMMYGNYYFSVQPGNKYTLEAKNGQKLVGPYDKSGLTSSDVKQIRKLYKC